MFRTLHTHPNRNYKYTPTLRCSGPSCGQGLPGLGNSLRAISRYRHPDKFPTPRHRWGLAWKPPGPQKSLAAKTRNESGAGAVPSPKRKFLLVKILSPCLVEGPGEVWGWRLEVSPGRKPSSSERLPSVSGSPDISSIWFWNQALSLPVWRGAHTRHLSDPHLCNRSKANNVWLPRARCWNFTFLDSFISSLQPYGVDISIPTL